MIGDTLHTLLDELDAWSRVRSTASFWWRDDDAGIPCASLDRLVSLSETHNAPCGLAVIPLRAGTELVQVVERASRLWVLQHGYAHINHAPSGAGAWELGLHRPTSTVLDELRAGMITLQRLFGDRFVPVVVPPWNKMDSQLLPYLPVMGYLGVSASYKKHRPVPPEGLRVADAQCDVLKWKKGEVARFAGAEKSMANLVAHIKDKRLGLVDEAEPTCILSHHLEMDEDAWNFMDDLLSVLNEHPAAQWMTPADIWTQR